MVESIQRTVSEHAIENTVAAFPIESDEMKGRIIGREGRNIRALDRNRSGIIDGDTPETIISIKL